MTWTSKQTLLQPPRLQYNALSGPPPPCLSLLLRPIPAFCQAQQQLTILNLASNALSGPPTPLSSPSCSASLQALYLSSNRLSGPIPATISSLRSLTRPRLDNNALTGPIPAGSQHWLLGQAIVGKGSRWKGRRVTGKGAAAAGQLQQAINSPDPPPLSSLTALLHSPPALSSLPTLPSLTFFIALPLRHLSLSLLTPDLPPLFPSFPFPPRALTLSLSPTTMQFHRSHLTPSTPPQQAAKEGGFKQQEPPPPSTPEAPHFQQQAAKRGKGGAANSKKRRASSRR
ncbi:unnamed protein product [Closterium sp. Naga37s-1]|nr:unnamed protein product [Closterium sp. Naga37s-1]